MNLYPDSKENSKTSSAECSSAQKVNNFRQNNALNQASFIPVYTKKADMCHNFIKEEKNVYKGGNAIEPTKLMKGLHSPPLRQKFHSEKNEMSSGKTWSMHARRRSVGFEDMTSLASRFGYSLSNGQRNCESINSNAESSSTILPRCLNAGNGKNLLKNVHDSENKTLSRTNRNTQVVQNENNQVSGKEKPSPYLKDKSAKRKSSLNRIDFLDFTNTSGNVPNSKRISHQKDSSSDEGSDNKLSNPKSEFLTSKRKQYAAYNQLPLRTTHRKTNEAHSTPADAKSNPLLPKALQRNHLKHRRVHSIASNLRKFSHSAGELENLTDLSETGCATSKICLSAQEFDVPPSPPEASKLMKNEPSLKMLCSLVLRNKDDASPNHKISSELNSTPSMNNFSELNKTSEETNLIQSSAVTKEYMLVMPDKSQSTLISLELDCDVKHIDSQSEEDMEGRHNTLKMENLNINDKDSLDIEPDTNNEDTEIEQRPSSILRKSFFEDKREQLHSILKAPSDEKHSNKTPPSILKHRESSEEKETWHPNDLHSILKKSASEEDSCNSGPDSIRPILKVSTDEDSSSGSLRPRPILKKRTSFSEECSYASYQSNELKPILKKKALNTEEQPKPILKSRRKSEDTKSTLAEFISSRPRAYSADMGVKQSHETRFEALELNKKDEDKSEQPDL